VKLIFFGILGLIAISFFNINSFGEVFQSDEDNFQIIIPESFTISKFYTGYDSSHYGLVDGDETTSIQIVKTMVTDFDSVNPNTLSTLRPTWFCPDNRYVTAYCSISPNSTGIIMTDDSNNGFFRTVNVIQNSQGVTDYIVRASLIPINGEWWIIETIWNDPIHYDGTIFEVKKIELSFQTIPSKNIVEISSTPEFQSDSSCGTGTIFDDTTNTCILEGIQTTSKCGTGTIFDDTTNTCILDDDDFDINFDNKYLSNFYFLTLEIVILFIVISIIVISYFIYRNIKNYQKSSLIKNKLLFKETFVVKSPNKNTVTVGVDYSNTRLNSTWRTGGTHVIKDGAMYGEYFMYFSQTSKNNEIRQLFESSLPLDGWTRKGEMYSMLTIASTEFEAELFFKKTCLLFEHQLKKNNFLNIP
jgi:hypothetical protein